MATHQIGNRNTVFTPANGNSTYILGKGKLIDSGSTGIQDTTGLQNLDLEIAGKIKALEHAIRIGDTMSPATGLSIEIAGSGRVVSQSYGIAVEAAGFEIENHGRISGVNGIRASGKDGGIDNDGTVTGTGAAIVASGEIGVHNGGTILGGQYGIVFNATANGVGSLSNTGTIEGASAAIMGSTGDDRIVNSGTIKGDISLRDGVDTFIFRGGKVTGEVRGGKDGDTYVVHAQGATIKELDGEGFDFVKASVSFTLGSNIEQLNLIGKANIDGTGNDQDNHIQGNSGRNLLRGEGGTDFLLGLAGNDRLFGGTGADYFNFQKGSGRDTVMDFEAGIDEIQIGGLKGAKGFDDMLANHVTEKGDDLWITYGGDVVVLKNTEIGDLLTGDFVFG